METEHVKITAKIDSNDTSSIQEIELQRIFYHLIGQTARSVSDKVIKEKFTAALKQWQA